MASFWKGRTLHLKWVSLSLSFHCAGQMPFLVRKSQIMKYEVQSCFLRLVWGKKGWAGSEDYNWRPWSLALPKTLSIMGQSKHVSVSVFPVLNYILVPGGWIRVVSVTCVLLWAALEHAMLLLLANEGCVTSLHTLVNTPTCASLRTSSSLWKGWVLNTAAFTGFQQVFLALWPHCVRSTVGRGTLRPCHKPVLRLGKTGMVVVSW